MGAFFVVVAALPQTALVGWLRRAVLLGCGLIPVLRARGPGRRREPLQPELSAHGDINP
jgi:hypothetical protein